MNKKGDYVVYSPSLKKYFKGYWHGMPDYTKKLKEAKVFHNHEDAKKEASAWYSETREVKMDYFRKFAEEEIMKSGGKTMPGRERLYEDKNVALEHNTISDKYSVIDPETGKFLAKGGNIPYSTGVKLGAHGSIKQGETFMIEVDGKKVKAFEHFKTDPWSFFKYGATNRDSRALMRHTLSPNGKYMIIASGTVKGVKKLKKTRKFDGFMILDKNSKIVLLRKEFKGIWPSDEDTTKKYFKVKDSNWNDIQFDTETGKLVEMKKSGGRLDAGTMIGDHDLSKHYPGITKSARLYDNSEIYVANNKNSYDAARGDLKDRYGVKSNPYRKDMPLYFTVDHAQFVEHMAKGGMTEHGLKRGDKIKDDLFWEDSVTVESKDKKLAKVDLNKGERIEQKRLGGGIDVNETLIGKHGAKDVSKVGKPMYQFQNAESYDRARKYLTDSKTPVNNFNSIDYIIQLDMPSTITGWAAGRKVRYKSLKTGRFRKNEIVKSLGRGRWELDNGAIVYEQDTDTYLVAGTSNVEKKRLGGELDRNDPILIASRASKERWDAEKHYNEIKRRHAPRKLSAKQRENLDAKISKASSEKFDLRFSLSDENEELAQMEEQLNQLSLDMEHEAGALRQNDEPVDDAFGNKWGGILMKAEEEIDVQRIKVKKTKKKYDDLKTIIEKWEDRLYA